jgi:hypothetical protein
MEGAALREMVENFASRHRPGRLLGSSLLATGGVTAITQHALMAAVATVS